MAGECDRERQRKKERASLLPADVPPSRAEERIVVDATTHTHTGRQTQIHRHRQTRVKTREQGQTHIDKEITQRDVLGG